MLGFVSADVMRLLPYIASAAFAVGVGLMAAMNTGRRREVRLFIAVLACEVAWVACFLLETLSADLEAKRAWDALHYPFALASDAALFLFALAYSHPSVRRPSGVLAAALGLPLLIAALGAAASALGYGAVFYATRPLAVLSFGQYGARLSALAYMLTGYGYVLYIAACAVLVRLALGQEPERSRGAIVMLIGLGLQLAASVISMAGQASIGSLVSSPLWGAAKNAAIAYGLLGERIVGSLSKARRAVMDTLLDPVFVLGRDDEVVDCNAAAKTLLGKGSGDIVGRLARELFADWPSGVSAALDFPEAETELDLPDRDGIPRRSYRITVASNAARDRSGAWKLLVFNDITGQKSDARDMAASNEELEFWVRQRTAALRQEVKQRTAAEERLRDLNEEMAKTQREILWTLSEVVESRSRETAYHVVRVGEYARIFAQGSGLSEEEVEIITTAAPMHDVGKIAIPDAILSKPGLLTPEEREVMKRHTVVGKEILGSSHRPLLRAAAVIAFEHHERWDGNGYPLGKAGTDISLSGRIVSLCDVFDALYTKRVYKDAWPLEKVLSLFKEESGKAFEPRLVDILFERLDDILDITRRFADESPVTHI